MGCWYGTCMVTNLPIYEGDPVALFVLTENSRRSQHSYCYTHGEYALFSLPVFGEYNDYGGIQNIEDYTNEEVTQLLTKQLMSAQDQDDESVITDVEKFINDRILRGEEDGKSAVMVHLGVYQKLIQEISKRVPYEQTKTYGELTKQNMEKFKTFEEEEFSFGYPHDIRYLNVVHFAETMSHRPLKRTLDAIRSTKSSVLSDLYVELYLFDFALDSLRQRWYVPCGAGSQGQELDLHCKVAEFVLNHKEQRINEYKERSIMELEEEKEFGKETIFYHGDED